MFIKTSVFISCSSILVYLYHEINIYFIGCKTQWLNFIAILINPFSIKRLYKSQVISIRPNNLPINHLATRLTPL